QAGMKLPPLWSDPLRIRGWNPQTGNRPDNLCLTDFHTFPSTVFASLLLSINLANSSGLPCLSNLRKLGSISHCFVPPPAIS
ncbi:MAG: hypothetical protein ACFFB3_16925, partial [Candidatus Hodarchaeota archaeon]